MSQNQDTVDLLQANIERWQVWCRETGKLHGHDTFVEALHGMRHLSGTIGPWEMPVPTTHRVVPRPFLVEWAVLIAKSRWRFSEEWFKKNGFPWTLVPTESRLIAAQHEGHDAGVDGAATFARLPKAMRLLVGIGIAGPLAWFAAHAA